MRLNIVLSKRGLDLELLNSIIKHLTQRKPLPPK